MQPVHLVVGHLGDRVREHVAALGLDGRIVGMTSFGESAPAGDLFREFGFTVDNVVAAVEEVLLD